MSCSLQRCKLKENQTKETPKEKSGNEKANKKEIDLVKENEHCDSSKDSKIGSIKKESK